MKLEYIREFVALTETMNYVEASDRLFISQSSLSKHIKSLEEELGVCLFDRNRHKVELAEAGSLFLPYARRLIDTYNEFSSALTVQSARLSGSIKVGAIPSMAQYGIADICAHFQHENENIVVSIVEEKSEVLLQMIKDGQLDFAFIRETDEFHVECGKVTVLIDTLAAVVPLEHPYAVQRTLSLSQLRDEPLITLSKDSAMASFCVSLCRQAGFEPRIVYTSTRAENILSFVSQGFGIALLSKIPVARLSGEQVVLLDVYPRVETSIILAFEKEQSLSGAAKLFLNMIRSM